MHAEESNGTRVNQPHRAHHHLAAFQISLLPLVQRGRRHESIVPYGDRGSLPRPWRICHVLKEDWRPPIRRGQPLNNRKGDPDGSHRTLDARQPRTEAGHTVSGGARWPLRVSPRRRRTLCKPRRAPGQWSISLIGHVISQLHSIWPILPPVQRGRRHESLVPGGDRSSLPRPWRICHVAKEDWRPLVSRGQPINKRKGDSHGLRRTLDARQHNIEWSVHEIPGHRRKRHVIALLALASVVKPGRQAQLDAVQGA
jgi:hypothetical protein